jgi:hypothetical protein
MNNFTPDGYVDLVATLLARGYHLSEFGAVKPDHRHLILRHDIDFDPEAALIIAEAEADHGWHAHYFVLTRSDFYNVSAPRCRAAIRKLRELGHSVGLHFDASQYGPSEMTTAIDDECAVVESITGSAASVFSLHRPHPDLLQTALTVPGRTNAYAPGFFRDIGYVSDSRGAWHHGSPLEQDAVAAGHALQMLTHPIWWTSDPDLSPHGKCVAFLTRQSENLEQEMLRNCSAYRGAGAEET